MASDSTFHHCQFCLSFVVPIVLTAAAVIEVVKMRFTRSAIRLDGHRRQLPLQITRLAATNRKRIRVTVPVSNPPINANDNDWQLQMWADDQHLRLKCLRSVRSAAQCHLAPMSTGERICLRIRIIIQRNKLRHLHCSRSILQLFHGWLMLEARTSRLFICESLVCGASFALFIRIKINSNCIMS